MAIKGYIKARNDGGFLVGANERESRYEGPVAEVYAERSWIVVNTDNYEGYTMLNIEALPHLRRALAKIAKSLRAHPTDGEVVR